MENEEKKTSFIEQYKQSLKSMDTEETIDLLFYRPIGFAWAKLCAKIGITPNVITIASIFLGIGAGIMFYFPHLLPYNIIGIFLLIWANSFDSADGQLARMTQQYSRLGRILDGLSGDLWFAAIYIAICLRMNNYEPFFMEHKWLIWTIAVVTGMCHAKQAAMADYYRQFHLFFLKGKEGSELDSVDVLDKRLAETPWKGNLWKRATMLVYRNYTANQETMTPSMQRLRKLLKNHFGEAISQQFRDAFRAKSKPLMKYTNWLSFNIRVLALFVAIFIGMPWVYFAFELTVLNIMLVYMIIRHEHICRHFINDINNGKF